LKALKPAENHDKMNQNDKARRIPGISGVLQPRDERNMSGNNVSAKS
jgi:hypothetical protein